MTTFDTREKEFEARFKHDQELQFKITARRNRLAGLWSAQHLGLLGDAAEAYAASSKSGYDTKQSDLHRAGGRTH
jgi:hypothetical protein